MGLRSKPALGIVLAALVALAAGCTAKRVHKPVWLMSGGDVSRYVSDALEHPDPDVRREAIDQLGRSRYASDPVVVQTFSVAARTDERELVRSAAVFALRNVDDGQTSLTVCQEVLGASATAPQPPPASAELRKTTFETAAVQLERLPPPAGQASRSRAGVLDPPRAAWLELALAALETDVSRDVRIAAAGLLGLIEEKRSAEALMDGLRQPDFGVAYQCARSLEHLTGQRFGVDPARWAEWFRRTERPYDQGLSRAPAESELSRRRLPWWRIDRWFARE